ncbi:GNAT family N-acetyltransferase [Ramlibacter sp.]|uniref:GNAT family N-acetyltransferase n=1 Tax=Ramlibacter sp. TaxID=1917967 RepID=UPI0017C41E48|nr:GNAT family N-acetyltransferase [Ramlibacter sp.]MBA2672839.1 GNAT family N-acetyltransferase [Ramlibacter sp.]
MTAVAQDLRVRALDSLQEIERGAYERLHVASGASVFYSWQFLVAAELSPLLPYRALRYLTAWSGDALVALMPAYLQENVDPFGVIEQTTGFPFTAATPVMLTHIMHATETRVVCAPHDLPVAGAALLRAMRDTAAQAGAHYAALLNVLSPELLELGKQQGYASAAMWDRFNAPLAPGITMEQLVENLPTKGRWEMKRQRRKFDQSDSTKAVLPVREADVAGFAELCFRTTKKNGTPDYYPVEPMKKLVALCADIARVIEIRSAGQLCGAGIVFPDRDVLHFWALGVDYELSDYSPYCMLFSTLYEHAIDNGFATVEVGRTNRYIKERLGFRPVQLHSLIAPLTAPLKETSHV